MNTSAATVAIAAETAARCSLWTSSEARNRHGSVVMSPSAVTIGVETESRSQPNRVDAADNAIVIARISAEPSAPPITEIVNRSQIEMDTCPEIAPAARASTASHSDDENVVRIATWTLRRSTPPGRRSSVSRPAAFAVPRRAPIAPKIVPFIPTAAGIKISRPGSEARVPVRCARVRPATKPAAVLRTSATRPWRIVRVSDRQ